MGAAAATDVLDGTLARRRGVALAGVGSWLDPVCDKLFVGAVLAALHVERGVPLGMLALIVARELLQLPMSVVYRAIPVVASLAALRLSRQRAGQGGHHRPVPGDRCAGASGCPPTLPIWLAFALGIIALIDYVKRAIDLGRARRETPMSETPEARRAGIGFCPRRGASATTCCSARWRCSSSARSAGSRLRT